MSTLSKEEKRERFEAMKKQLSGGGAAGAHRLGAELEPIEQQSPSYPFDVQVGGEPHRVVMTKRGAHIGYVNGDGELMNLRSVSEEQALEYWESRKSP